MISDSIPSRKSHDLSTHLNEPLRQQIDSLSHSRVVLRKQLDDEFWRTTNFKIPSRHKNILLNTFQDAFHMSINTGYIS